MNGVRSTFMRRGYLLTALSALLLLAASTGTAEAQRVSIGFVDTSGQVSEKAYLNANSLAEPQRITVRVQGLAGGARRAGDIFGSLGNVAITASKAVHITTVNPATRGLRGNTPVPARGSYYLTLDGEQDEDASATAHDTLFANDDEVVVVVAQSSDATPDGNWLDEVIELKLTVDGSASVSPDVFTLTVNETHVAPVAKFLQPDFTLSEQSMREVELDIASGIRGVPLPGAEVDGTWQFAGSSTAFVSRAGTSSPISVRVGNHGLVAFGGCPAPNTGLYNRKLFSINIGANNDNWVTDTNFDNTGVLTTTADSGIRAIADQGPGVMTNATASFEITGCGDGAGIRDPYITLTVMSSGLSGYTAAGPTYGSIETGPSLMISIDSDEAAPTLSFSPTDVTIDEGGSVETVLLADGPNAGEVGMVKLMVEGDAMVDLYQGDEMLEEMNGYVMVDLGGNSSARLTAMSMESRELQDGDMAYKAWKLVEGETDGAHIGEGSWFRVDVVGMTAVPALPLIGQLLLALFLMAGGSRLYRRRQG